MSPFIILLIVAAVLLILSIVLKNWILGAIALGAVICALLLGHTSSKSSHFGEVPNGQV